MSVLVWVIGVWFDNPASAPPASMGESTGA